MGIKYQLLKTSWTYQTRQFFRASTLHGVRYVAEHGRPIHERLLWFCSTAVGLVAGLIVIDSLWDKFQTSPTITGLDTDYHSWDVPFPAVTLCLQKPHNESLLGEYIDKKWPNSPEDKKEYYMNFLLQLTNISYSNLPALRNYTLDTSLPQNRLRDMSFEIMNQCHILSRCAYKDSMDESEVDCCTLFYPIYTEHGFCYAFNLNSSLPDWPWEPKQPPFQEQFIEETDARWSISFEVEDAANNSVRVFLTASEDMPGADMRAQHTWNKRISKISFVPKATYTTVDARQLSIKQRGCVFADELKLRVSDKYSYSACMTQCRMERLMGACGCVPFFHHPMEGFKHCSLQKLRCVIDKLDLLAPNNLECPCKLGCSHTMYDTEKPHEAGGEGGGDGSFLEVGFLSWPLTRYKREVLFGWVDLLVSFGTIAGLFLGFSLLSGVELIYYFTLRAWCMVQMERERLEDLAKEYAKKERPQVDLTLHPKMDVFSTDGDKDGVLGSVGSAGLPPVGVEQWRRDRVFPKSRKSTAFYYPYVN